MLTSLLMLAVVNAGPSTQPLDFDVTAAARFARLALECVHREYPNKISHVLNDDRDARPPQELTPAFFGCYDWHSAVHGHWLLARLARLFPDAPFAAEARAALARSLTDERLEAEAAYLSGPGRVAFERPYGLAWLLQLASELREWSTPETRAWLSALAPLEQAAAARIADWVPKLTHPVRAGVHAQTAFAFGLILDWARSADQETMVQLIATRSRELYGADRACPIAYEPSGQDFLSPCLAEADLMRRILEAEPFAEWLSVFLPTLDTDAGRRWLVPVVVSDPSDPQLGHLDGLNLSRAWMLDGVAAGLPDHDSRRETLHGAARRHREAGLRAVTGEHYEGGHWLGTFAVYLVTQRGLTPE